MKKRLRPGIIILVGLLLLSMFSILIRNGNMELLNPQGYIALRQSYIIYTALIFGLVIGIPVIIAMFYIACKYKDDKPTPAYAPDWKASKLLVASWWIVPSIIIFFWAIMGWQSAHELDPTQKINTPVKPVVIQVIALSWKWIFIYPQEHIATVNAIEFPVNTPIDFEITADTAPYSSFWIPSLGSQIYAMNGMQTQLHLIATNTGSFPGEGTELNGDGFAGMKFTAKSVQTADYNNWLQTVKLNEGYLDQKTYNDLLKPSSYNKPQYFNYTDNTLFNNVIKKFMPPGGMVQTNNMNTNI